MKKIFIFNGPNLNLLGTREPGVYGAQTLADVVQLCQQTCTQHGVVAECRQSNHEGVLVDWLHEAGAAQAAGEALGVVLNAGAYTHTSVALRDAVKGAGVRLVELHISNVHAREEFRQHSWLSAVAAGVMFGFGVNGYALAITALVQMQASAITATAATAKS